MVAVLKGSKETDIMFHEKAHNLLVPFFARVMVALLVNVIKCSGTLNEVVILSARFEVLTAVITENSIF
jgi:hypothetical protein